MDVFEAECAIAEYDTTNKEFVLISKLAAVRLSERPVDKQLYFSVEDRTTKVHEEEDKQDKIKRRFFVDQLTRDVQMWPSLQTSQLTFWGVHHQNVSIDKVMFILEFNEATVGRSAISKFFNFLALALMDRTFVSAEGKNDGQVNNELIPMDDEGFDLGELGGKKGH